MNFLSGILAGSSILLLSAALCALWLHRASASIRYAVWAMAVISLLILPLAQAGLPRVEIPLLPARAPDVDKISNGSTSRAFSVPALVTEQAPSIRGETTAPSERAEIQPTDLVTLSDWAFGIWIVGFLIVGGRLIAGTLAVSRISRRSRVADDGSWPRLLGELQSGMSIASDVTIRIAESSLPPLTWGLSRHTILLPSGATRWDEQRRTLVLAHELAHIRRRDGLMQLLVQCTSALYWFHPLLWYATHRLGIERERACDDQVLAMNVRPADYAQHLLGITRGLGSRVSLTAVAMANSSQLEGRVLAILNPRSRRQTISRLGLATLFAIAVVVTASSAALELTRAQTSPGAETGVVLGRIVAPDGGPLVKARVAVVSADDPDQRGEGRTDDRGEYRVWNLEPGDYYVAVLPEAPGEGSIRAYATTYYPATLRFDEAEAVRVEAGDARVADLLAQPASGVSVSGSVEVEVEGLSGGLPPPFLLDLLPHARSPIGVSSSHRVGPVSTIESEGRFEIPNVEPGTYDLVASALGVGGERHFGWTRLDVGPNGIRDALLRIRPNQSIPGIVRLHGAVARPMTAMDSIRLRLYPASPTNELAELMRLPMTAPDQAGAFLFRGVPEGDYGLAVSGGMYLAGLRRDNGPVETLSPESSGNAGYEILLDQAGSVEVGVVDVEGEALFDVAVTLTRAGGTELRNTTDANGYASFGSLLPGPYTVAFPDGGVLSSIEAGMLTIRPGVELSLTYTFSKGEGLLALRSPDQPGVRGSVWSQNVRTAASLLLVPQDALADFSRYRLFETDSDGAFSFSEALPEGRYVLMAFGSLPEGWQSDAQFVSSRVDLGRVVDYSPTTESRVHLSIIPSP